MSVASEIYVDLKTNRPLEKDEINEFNSHTFIDIKEFAIVGTQVVSINPENNKLIEYFNSWILKPNHNGTHSLDMNIKKDEEEHYFVESLIFLIEHFFEPKGIKINGHFNGYDNIFGFTFRYNVIDNKIYYDFENSIHKIKLDDIFQKLSL